MLYICLLHIEKIRILRSWLCLHIRMHLLSRTLLLCSRCWCNFVYWYVFALLPNNNNNNNMYLAFLSWATSTQPPFRTFRRTPQIYTQPPSTKQSYSCLAVCHTTCHSIKDVHLIPLELIRSKCHSVTKGREAHLISNDKTFYPLGINRRGEAC